MMDKNTMEKRLFELLEEYNERFGPWPINASMRVEEWIKALEECLRNNSPYRDADGNNPGMYM